MWVVPHTAPPTFIVPLCKQRRGNVMSGQEVSGRAHQLNPSRVSSWGHSSAPRPCLACLTGLDGFPSQQRETMFLTNDGSAVPYGAVPAILPHVLPSPTQVLAGTRWHQNTVVSFFSRLLLVLLCCPECSDLWAASANSPPPLSTISEKHTTKARLPLLLPIRSCRALPSLVNISFLFSGSEGVEGCVFASGVTSLKLHFKKRQ